MPETESGYRVPITPESCEIVITLPGMELRDAESPITVECLVTRRKGDRVGSAFIRVGGVPDLMKPVDVRKLAELLEDATEHASTWVTVVGKAF